MSSIGRKLAPNGIDQVVFYRQQFPALKIYLIDAVGGSFKTAVHDEIEFVDLLEKAGI